MSTSINPEEGGAAVKRSSYIVRHWRGDLSLSMSVWVNIFGVMVLIGVLRGILMALVGLDGHAIAVLVVLLGVMQTAVACWQVVGAFRASQKHVGRGGTKAVALLAALLTFAFGINAARSVGTRLWPQTQDLYAILTGTSAVPDYHIRTMDDWALFEGGLRVGAAKDLERFLRDHPGVDGLIIDSEGGRLTEALAMAGLVRERALTTATRHYCMSGATLVLLAGAERFAPDTAQIGFHSSQANTHGRYDQVMCDRLFRRAFQDAGMPDWFVQKVMETPFEEMWFPTREELEKAGVASIISVVPDPQPSSVEIPPADGE